MALYGNDIDETTNTPLEAGLGAGTKLDKRGTSSASDALLAQKAAGLNRKLVGFEVNARAMPPVTTGTLLNAAGATSAASRAASCSPSPPRA